MKIIKRGIDPAKLPVAAKCRKCSTEIEFLPEEAVLTSCQREGNFYTIKCPVCHYIISQNV